MCFRSLGTRCTSTDKGQARSLDRNVDADTCSFPLKLSLLQDRLIVTHKVQNDIVIFLSKAHGVSTQGSQYEYRTGWAGLRYFALARGNR